MSTAVTDPTDEERAWAIARAATSSAEAARALIAEAAVIAERVARNDDFQRAVRRVAAALLDRQELDAAEVAALIDQEADDG